MLHFIAFQSPSVGFSTLLATILTAEAISGRDVTDKYDRDPTAYLYRLLESGERKQWNNKKTSSIGVFASFASCSSLRECFQFFFFDESKNPRHLDLFQPLSHFISSLF